MRCLQILTITLLFGPLLFGQSTEPLLITHGPWLQNLSEHGVTVCFTTNLPAVPGVMLGFGDSGADSLIRNSTDGLIHTGVNTHQVRLTGLKPGTGYVYRIHAVELLKHRPYQVYYGDTIKGKEFRFSTREPQAEVINYLIINDIHTNGAKLASFLKSGKAADQDLVIYNGDIVDNFETVDQLLGPIMDTSVRYFASEVPFVFVRGNHETRGILSRRLRDYLDFPDGRYYYAFDQGPVHVVVLDCGEDKPDTNRYYYGLADFDRYRLQQLEWLKVHLQSDEYRRADFRLIIIHMPIMPGERAGYGPKFLFEHFGPVLREAGADLMVSAHTHRIQWLDASSSGLGFPVLINGSNSFITLEANRKTLSFQVVTDKEEVTLSKQISR